MVKDNAGDGASAITRDSLLAGYKNKRGAGASPITKLSLMDFASIAVNSADALASSAIMFLHPYSQLIRQNCLLR